LAFKPRLPARARSSRKHVVDLALVDVADDRPLATALDVELGDLEIGVSPGSRGALALEHRDAGLARID